jgi:hypothetical protein
LPTRLHEGLVQEWYFSIMLILYAIVSIILLFVFFFYDYGLWIWATPAFLSIVSLTIPAFSLCSWPYALFYLCTVYLRNAQKSAFSTRCVFMPCAPQSIKDDDQLYSLLAGTFLTVGLEIVWPAFNWVKKNSDREFVRMVKALWIQLRHRREREF